MRACCLPMFKSGALVLVRVTSLANGSNAGGCVGCVGCVGSFPQDEGRDLRWLALYPF